MSRYNYKILCVDGSTALCHHGIKGMKWGIRRYQNADGSLTPEGRDRYLSKKHVPYGHAKSSYDLSKDGHKAVKKFRKKNPGNYSDALLNNEWEHDFGTKEFAKEVTVKYGSLIDQGKIFTKEFADMAALDDKAWGSAIGFSKDLADSRYRREKKAYGAKLTNDADAMRKESRQWTMESLERDQAHKHEFAKERGLSSPNDVFEYLKKAATNLNEMNPGHMLTDEEMDDEVELRKLGYINEETFGKLRDAQLSRDVYQLWEDLVYNTSPEDYSWFDEWHDADQKK